MTNSKQGNVKDIFSFWKHTKGNEKINETILTGYYLTKYCGSTHQWFRFCFPLCCGMVMYDWESEFKTKEKSIWTEEKIVPQHLLTAFTSKLKGRNKCTISYCFFFFNEDDENISWLPSVKQSTLKRMQRNNLGISSSLTFK